MYGNEVEVTYNRFDGNSGDVDYTDAMKLTKPFKGDRSPEGCTCNKNRRGPVPEILIFTPCQGENFQTFIPCFGV